MTRMQFISLLSVCILIALILGGCGQATPTPTPARFEAVDCMFPVPAGYTIDCGYLFVPEDRSQPDSPLIQLHVAIVRSPNQTPAPDPVVYLEGGPGAHTLDGIAYYVTIFQNVLGDRDVIFLDQRGVGYSRPSLNCPEVEEQIFQDMTLNLSREEGIQHYVQANQACHDRLVSEGIHLAAYTSAANAADVNDLRIALGYSEWNLYGKSYGTRLALTVMRDYPEGVRSVVLDSVYPPQVDLFAEEAGIMVRSFDLLFERCAADASCSDKYPELRTVFYELVARLDAEPVTLAFARPGTAQSYEVVVNGDRMIVALWGLMYSADYIPWVPRYIYEFHQGRWGDMPNMFFAYDSMSEGMRLSVQCGEEVRFSSPEALEAATASVQPRLRAIFNEPIFAVCAAWGAKPADPVENEPVASDIPTLILQGDYDPATPPAWGQLAAETLSQAYYLEFPGFGHGVLGVGLDGGRCSRVIVDTFLAVPDSAPDASCLTGLRVFFVTNY